MLEAWKMGKRKDLSTFDKGQIVMAGRQGQCIYKMAGLVGCSQYAVVSTYQNSPRKDNWWAKDKVTGDQCSLMYVCIEG